MTKQSLNTILLLFSQLFSVIGTTILQFVIALYVLDLSHSAQMFSLIIAATFFGRVLCLPFAGVMIDQMSKKKMMMALDGAYFLITALFMLLNQYKQSNLFFLIFVFIIGLISAFETPLSQASLSLLYDEESIQKMTGFVTAISMFGSLIGPILASLIYRFNAVNFSYSICIILFIAAWICELFLNIPEKLQKQIHSFRDSVRLDYLEVTQQLKKQPIILKICLFAFLLNVILASFVQVVIPYLARVILAVTDQQYGILQTFFAFGGLLGAILYSLFAKIKHKPLITFMIIIGFIFIIFGYVLKFKLDSSLTFYLILSLISIILCLISYISVHLISAIQLQVHANMVGRMMSFVLLLSTLATPLGQLIWGQIIQTLNQEDYIRVGWSIALIVCLITMLFRKTLITLQH
ncbi:MFS transporter [Vagococcus silagei]|uniref:MFS transporter n=1 Tax=Vagococcus silagei TaxID=2508885 RepID=A0A4S3B3I4_9ENTE|nr:MFS transporter [Vagococcus silagei]THB60330.1 MFS transporter [Vagococcus silagei]